MRPRVRSTAVLIEDGKILLLRVRDPVSDSSSRRWSLPGGGLEYGETVESCLMREMREETGLEVEVKRLLYVCDRISNGDHVLHLTFLVRRLSGRVVVGEEPEANANEILDAQFVPIGELSNLGFSPVFQEIVAHGFPDSGTYMGSIENIGL